MENISASGCYFTEHILFPKQKKRGTEKREGRGHSGWHHPVEYI